MKINSFIQINGSKIILVPYLRKHVLKYHSWMQSTELQELTASDPLTLEEEYKMQQSWLEDEDKCTFIVLDKEAYDKSHDDIESMIGDVNLFFNEKDKPDHAEIEIMIAENQHRGKGRGKEALLFMLRYGAESLAVSQYIAKIKEHNHTSIQLFESIGFKEVNRSTFFNEITYELSVSKEWLTDIQTNTSSFVIEPLTNLCTNCDKIC